MAGFYDRMLADERVSHYFDNVSIARLRAHQRSFLVAALGDPGTFNGLTLQHAHFRMRLSDEEFDITAEHLVASLHEAGVPVSLRSEIQSRLERVRPHIVAPQASDRGPGLRPLHSTT